MLQEIVASKRLELIATKAAVPLEEVLRGIPSEAPPGFATALTGRDVNIIAEIKYRSPSRGDFNCRFQFKELAGIYAEHGAAAISVLTESRYFSGKLEYLSTLSKELPETPLLRKDFIVDRYQVAESRAAGAAACLFIVSCLCDEELKNLLAYGRELGLEALVEVHDLFELDRAMEAEAPVIGVNNRDLKTFSVNVQTSFDVARRMEGEEGPVLVSESGIDDPSQIAELHDAGFSAFLIGSALMEAEDPGAALLKLRGRG